MDLEQKFKLILPQATDWITTTLAAHASQAPLCFWSAVRPRPQQRN
jgi:hypothetical protein